MLLFHCLYALQLCFYKTICHVRNHLWCSLIPIWPFCLQAVGRLAASGASDGHFSAPSRQASSSLSPRQGSTPRRLAIQDGSASPSAQAPGRAHAFSRQYADKQADPTVQQALTGVLAEAVQHRCFDDSIDSAWLSATHESWRTIISTAIHKNSMNRRLPAQTDIPGAADSPRAGADTSKNATQVAAMANNNIRPAALNKSLLSLQSSVSFLCHCHSHIKLKLTFKSVPSPYHRP